MCSFLLISHSWSFSFGHLVDFFFIDLYDSGSQSDQPKLQRRPCEHDTKLQYRPLYTSHGGFRGRGKFCVCVCVPAGLTTFLTLALGHSSDVNHLFFPKHSGHRYLMLQLLVGLVHFLIHAAVCHLAVFLQAVDVYLQLLLVVIVLATSCNTW